MRAACASRPAALALALACAAGPAAAARPAAPAPTRDEVARLQRESVILKQFVELSKGKDFYLLLDPRAKSLRMNLKGATLQTWPILGLEVGGPRVAYVSRGVPEDWEGRIWKQGNLDPERKIDRFEMIAPAPTKEGTETNIPIPPTPEEAYPVPARYHIRYSGGLSIEVLPPGSKDEGGLWSRWGVRLSNWWHDAREALSSTPTDAVRLRVVLSEKDADSLYRALPPNTALLVVPPRD
jgi:hypothetical protein